MVNCGVRASPLQCIYTEGRLLVRFRHTPHSNQDPSTAVSRAFLPMAIRKKITLTPNHKETELLQYPCRLDQERAQETADAISGLSNCINMQSSRRPYNDKIPFCSDKPKLGSPHLHTRYGDLIICNQVLLVIMLRRLKIGRRRSTADPPPVASAIQDCRDWLGKKVQPRIWWSRSSEETLRPTRLFCSRYCWLKFSHSLWQSSYSVLVTEFSPMGARKLCTWFVGL
jgi:hypothetical protein